MIQERWERLNEVFHAAVGLRATERDAYLASACDGDQPLRAEVERLVEAHERVGHFIDTPALEHAGGGRRADGDDESVAAGRRFGAYRVVRELGRGGMGVVFLAERSDGQFDQRVAIKLIKRGMDTEVVLRRFRAERQILASLQHPNIARLLDGGTTDDGLPYFVMEYIDGQPVDRYASERRLTIDERLRLFLEVCAAVAYAHQQLVVHRDIKPLNILVTADGKPKLLDFGIAKVLHDEAGEEPGTVTGYRLLTPEYASPEQAEGRRATTASDVYALGVVLYELLTGRSPYRLRSRTPHEILESVRTTEPERPSAAVTRPADPANGGQGAAALDWVHATRGGGTERLRRRLRGDLDTIVLTALRKEPDRRYASVERFADDVRRHLDGLPVRARADSLLYRAGKFVRRNRAAVTAGALIALALVGGTVATAVQAREARAQARLARAAQGRAERRFNDVRKLANTVLFDYHDAIKDLPGATPVRARLVRDALQYLDTLAHEAQGDRSLQYELASAYRRVGEVQGGSTVASLGDTRGALASYQKGLRILEALWRAEPGSVRARREIADMAVAVSYVLWETGDLTGGLQQARRARELLEPLVGANPADSALRATLLRAYDVFGSISIEAGDARGALDSHRKQLDILRSYPDSVQRQPRVRRSLSVAYDHIASAQVELGELPAALENFRRVVALRAALAAEFPQNADYQRILGAGYFWEADVLAKMGRTREALDRYRRNLAIGEAQAAADPEAFAGDIAYALVPIGDMLARLGEHGQALASYRRARDVRAADAAGDSASLWKRSSLIEANAKICKSLATLARRGEALSTCAATVALMDRTTVEPANASIRGLFAIFYSVLGEAYATLATARVTDAADRRVYRETARDMCGRSREIFADMAARKILSEGDTAAVTGVATIAIARCKAAVPTGVTRRDRRD